MHKNVLLGASIRRYAPDFRQCAHRHDTASVTLVLRGRLRETVGRSDVTAESLSLVVKPAGVSHANVFGPEQVATCQIVLRPEVHDHPRWRDALDRWRWIVGGPCMRAALELAKFLRNPDGEHLDKHEMVSAVLDSLHVPDARTPAPPWLSMATEFIRDQIRSGVQRIRVTEVASVAGVHPGHLSRVFQVQFGCTVSAWVRRQRVQRVATSLATSNVRLSMLASQVGFADQSHMNRSFCRETTLLPTAFRGLVATISEETAGSPRCASPFRTTPSTDSAVTQPESGPNNRPM